MTLSIHGGIAPGTAVILRTAVILGIAGILYAAGDRMTQAEKALTESRAATLHTHRIAQSLKSLANAYELAMNEYYSTVLEYPAYRRKAGAHQASIAAELAALARMQAAGAGMLTELNGAFREMETYRAALESALAGEDKDWDAAREALFKVNVVSVRAIQQADLLARVANEQAAALDTGWQAHQAGALTLLRVAMGLALGLAGLGVAGAVRYRRAACRG